MGQLNRDLETKLERLPNDVRQLAMEALTNAERLPDSPLSQYLEQTVRRIAREFGQTLGRGEKTP